MRLLICLLLAFSCQLAYSQSDLDISVPDGPKPWTHLDLNNDSQQFQFAIVTDRTGGHRPGVFMDGVRKLNLLQPEFVMSVGDLIEGYTEDTIELVRQWEEFDGFVDALEMPFFYLPGNHDITNKVMQDLWKKRLGPTHYYFKYKDVLFMCLDSEDQYRGASKGSVSDEQYEWIKNVLAENTDVRWTMVFMHQPLWLQDTDPVRWADVEKLLADREHSVFVGHRHHYVKYERNNGKYFMLATTGGSNALRGPELGEFDHVVWVTMTEQGPVIANLQLEGIWSEDVMTEDVMASVDKLQNANALRIEPFYAEDPMAEGEVKIKIVNDEDVPMLVKIKDGFSWSFKSSLDKNEIEVAPNSVEFVTMELMPRKKKIKQEFDPVEIQASVQFAGTSDNKIAIPYTYKVAPEKKFQLERSRSKIKLDGNLKEWKTLPYTLNTEGTDAEDCSAQFNLTYDDKYVYFAAKVTDNDLQLDTGEVAWRQDFIGLIMDAAPTNVSAMRKGEGWYNKSILYTITPATDKLPSSTFYDERLPEGTKWMCKTTNQGYVLEAAIPVQYIKERQGKDWRTIRINMVVQDRDSGDTDFDRYTWMSDWRGKNNRVGSGMFFRK